MSVLRLAWRNIWRNRRRSLITVSAVLFSMLIIVLTRSLQYGTYDAMEAQAVRLLHGEIQIQGIGYQDDPTVNRSFRSSDLGDDLLTSRDWLVASSHRVTGFGLVSADDASVGAMIVGVEPDAESEVSTFLNEVIDGLPLDSGVRGDAIIGEGMRDNLRLEIGDTLVVLTQGYRNQMGAEVYRVRGVVRTGVPEFDRALMAVHIEDAQQLFAMEGRFTQLVVRTSDFRVAAGYAKELEMDVDGERVAVLDWYRLLPELRQMVFLDNVSGLIFLLFLMILLGFEIFNTTNMAVLERVREFGVMQALGMKPSRITTLVATELVLKLGISLLVSGLVSGLLLAWLHGNPIPLTEEMTEAYEQFGMSFDSLLFSTRRAVFVEPFLAIAATTLLSAIGPLVRVYRLRTVEALRRPT